MNDTSNFYIGQGQILYLAYLIGNHAKQTQVVTDLLPGENEVSSSPTKEHSQVK